MNLFIILCCFAVFSSTVSEARNLLWPNIYRTGETGLTDGNIFNVENVPIEIPNYRKSKGLKFDYGLNFDNYDDWQNM